MVPEISLATDKKGRYISTEFEHFPGPLQVLLVDRYKIFETELALTACIASSKESIESTAKQMRMHCGLT